MSIAQLLIIHHVELLTLCVIALLMAISPGADFVLVTRNSLSYSRGSGLYTAFGITFGTWVHVAYCIAGMAIVISTSPVLFSILKYVGAGYLIVIGLLSFKANKVESNGAIEKNADLKPTTAFASGFLSNALNPKTTLFFLGIFTQFVTAETPIKLQFMYGSIISLAHLLWFSLLSYLLTHQKLLPTLNKYQKVINYIMGTALVVLGLKLIVI